MANQGMNRDWIKSELLHPIYPKSGTRQAQLPQMKDEVYFADMIANQDKLIPHSGNNSVPECVPSIWNDFFVAWNPDHEKVWISKTFTEIISPNQLDPL